MMCSSSLTVSLHACQSVRSAHDEMSRLKHALHGIHG